MSPESGAGPLAKLRVLEVATEIAGPYCGKLFADAGADVVKVEEPDGDPLRRWTACGIEVSDDSALFQFLNTSKRSVVGAIGDPHIEALARGSDIVVFDERATTAVVERLRACAPAAVVVTISPFGLSGPWHEEHLPATEFTLQGWCGSAGGRGLPA